MRMRACITPDPSTIELVGEWDIGRVAVLRRRLDDLLKEGRPLVVDLSRATFLDSTALGVLLGARTAWEQRGLAMALVVNDGTAYTVRNAIHLLGIDRIFPIFSTMDEATGRSRMAG